VYFIFPFHVVFPLPADGVNASLLNAPLPALQPKLVFAIEPSYNQPQIFRINITFKPGSSESQAIPRGYDSGSRHLSFASSSK
jgi:hypothetical protein